MNDNDIDSMLRRHAEVWRDANADQPAVEWQPVTGSGRRLTIAVLGVAVAVAVVVVSVVMGVGAGSSRSSQPGAHPSVTPSETQFQAMQGAPQRYFGLRDGALLMRSDLARGRQETRRTPFGALAVATDERTAYVAVDLPRCRTEIESEQDLGPAAGGTRFGGLNGVRPFPGRAVNVAMAISPNDNKIALVSRSGCRSRESLDIVDLTNGSLSANFPVPENARVDALQWSPNNVTLAFRIRQACASCHGISAGGGTHLLDTANATSLPVAAKPLLPLLVGDVVYGPVFWWHGQLATVFEGALCTLNGHGVDKVVATGFPSTGWIKTLSSDPTGDHLLLIASNGSAYRWDNGFLTRLPGRWDQLAW